MATLASEEILAGADYYEVLFFFSLKPEIE